MVRCMCTMISKENVCDVCERELGHQSIPTFSLVSYIITNEQLNMNGGLAAFQR